MMARMGCKASLVAAAAVLALASLAAPALAAAAGGWIDGRATHYGADGTPFAEAYKARGIGSFGVLEYGSCGFTNIGADGSSFSLPFGADTYAAVADVNPDYPGSCGRCYEVRCKNGLVYDQGKPVPISKFYYLAKANDKVPDNRGRSFPGNPAEGQGLQFVKCWNDTSSIIVRIGDSCPCYQKKPNGKVEKQFWCCGGNQHFDLSYTGFSKIAHPVYGVIPIEFRPVSCHTKKPLQYLPGFVNSTIYMGGPEAGWGWRPYLAKATQLRAGAGSGLDGRGSATCGILSKGGALPFMVRNGTQPGYRPFTQASSLVFWTRSNTKSTDKFFSSTPKGSIPPLKVFLMNDEKSLFCSSELSLQSSKPAASRVTNGMTWYKYQVPLSTFKCDGSSSAGSLANVNRVDFMNTAALDAYVCLDGIALTK